MRKTRLIFWLLVRMFILVAVAVYVYRNNYSAATFHVALYILSKIAEEPV